MYRVASLIRSLMLILVLSLSSVSGQESTSVVAQARAKADAKAQPGDQVKAAEAKTSEPAKEKSKDQQKQLVEEQPVVSRHRVRVDGKDLKYTAVAGFLPITDSKGDVEAHIFFMAYTLDDAGPLEDRPLLFSFNGGPGSASVWLHLGALGPRRVAAPEGPTIPAPPFRLVENDATWLDRTDLVFIDPIGTGYSRAAKPELNSKFHSMRGDIESVGEFIRMYLTRYDRWASPLYLIGESYGTTRAAGLAGHLIDRGIAFSGLVLVSCALDFQGFVFSPGNEPGITRSCRVSCSAAGCPQCSRKLSGGLITNMPRSSRVVTGSPKSSSARRQRTWRATLDWPPPRSRPATCGLSSLSSARNS
jgi:carboxypeptidase C (cathepsin A)